MPSAALAFAVTQLQREVLKSNPSRSVIIYRNASILKARQFSWFRRPIIAHSIPRPPNSNLFAQAMANFGDGTAHHGDQAGWWAWTLIQTIGRLGWWLL